MRYNLKPLSRQVVVITGASSGNGLATARAAAKRGAAVVLAARNGEALDTIRQEIEASGGRATACVADVAVKADVERIATTALDAFGTIDSWVNDAAAATFGRIEDVPGADQRRIFDVNYHGLMTGTLVALKHMRKRGGGAIVNIGSVLSDRAMIYQGPYSASKAAVQAATDALRMELRRERVPVSVTLIKPGAIATPYAEHARNFMAGPPRLPAPLYDPALVAEAVLFACEHPRRHIWVGGAGFLLSLAGRLAPRVVDAAMERVGARVQQTDGDPGDPAKRDNLYEPRADGTVHGQQYATWRRSSLLLKAQTDPALVALAAAGVGLAGGLARALSPRKG